MSQIREVIAWTVLRNLHDLRLLLLGAGCIALLVGGTVMSIIEYSGRIEETRRLVSLAEQQKSLESVKIVRPPPPLSFIRDGGESKRSRFLIVLPDFVDYPMADVSSHSFLSRGQMLDWAFVVSRFFSLIIILGLYDFISGEKTTGTLRLLCSMPVPRGTVLVGGTAGSVISIAPFLMVGALCSLLLVIVDGRISVGPEEWIRILVFLMLSLLYLTCVASLVMLISSMFSHPGASLFACLFVWVAFSLIIPGAAALGAPVLAPVPSTAEFQKQIEGADMRLNASVTVSSIPLSEIIDRADFSDEQKRVAVAALQDRWKRQHEDALVRFKREVLQFRETYLSQLQNQQRLADKIALLSPASTFEQAAEAVAGAGSAYERRFYAAALQYMRAYTPVAEKLREELRSHAKVSGPRVWEGEFELQGISSISYDDVPFDRRTLPRFQGYVASLTTDLGEGLARVAYMALVALGSLATALHSFSRYDVR